MSMIPFKVSSDITVSVAPLSTAISISTHSSSATALMPAGSIVFSAVNFPAAPVLELASYELDAEIVFGVANQPHLCSSSHHTSSTPTISFRFGWGLNKC